MSLKFIDTLQEISWIFLRAQLFLTYKLGAVSYKKPVKNVTPLCGQPFTNLTYSSNINTASC